ncbi:MAG: hypothetical protein ABR598_03585 [Candidatus Dormibacteria bacterium]
MLRARRGWHHACLAELDVPPNSGPDPQRCQGDQRAGLVDFVNNSSVESTCANRPSRLSSVVL